MEINNALTEQEKAAGLFTPEVMWKMGRIGSSVVSPDGTQAVFATTYYNMEENKGVTSLYVVPVAGGAPERITDLAGNDSDPSWNAEGTLIYFLSDRSGESQLWTINPKDKSMSQLSQIKGGIDGYGVSPDSKKAFYTQKVRVEKRESKDVHPDMAKSQALIYDDLMERHWDYWDRGDYSHIFIADIFDGVMETGKDIMPGEPWDAPMAPYFDIHEIAWNNAGTQLAYTCKKLTGTKYATLTDSDIYLYDLASGTTANLTEGNVGYDKYPVFSPDDTKIAYQSMERPNNESDKDRLFVVTIESGAKQYLTQNFDYNAQNIVWTDNDNLLFISPITATYQVCGVSTQGGDVRIITSGDHDINAFTMGAGKIVAEMTTISMATELFNIDAESGAISQLTDINKETYDNIKMGEVRKRWVTTTDNKQMLTWVILPPDFDSTKTYPTLLYCQGGPQSVVSQSFSFRWNYQLMAAQGYIVVAPNRRGLPSFGQEWLDQISGDYSGQNIRDYLSAIDDVSKESWSDQDRLGCVGASYGGYSVFYLAGVHQNRFKAFIAHCGVFNMVSEYGATEELFFPDNDYKGPYWSDNATAKRSYANSPHTLVNNWNTPILIITGLKDFRIPYTQSLEAFTAARLHNVPSRLVAFENEAHQVFKPQNNMVWNREFFGWLDKYLKK
jgi:dipeptidyl aminopeptidase/acylaminoacyl peptidase